MSIPAGEYSLLLNNIRGGITPSLITVEFKLNIYDERSPLKYGHAPDGSDVIWFNAMKQNRHIDVESIEFHYRLIDTERDDDEEPKPPTTKASIDAAKGHLRS